MSGRLTWQVPSHRPLQLLADDLWCVDADLSSLPIGRRMVVARLSSGTLLVHSAICADESTMTELDALGPVGIIVVPNGYHRMDAAAWKHRYPRAAVLSPAGSRARVKKAVDLDGELSALPVDARFTWSPLAGVPSEAVFLHRDNDGNVTAVFNDCFFNLPKKIPGVRGWVTKMMGSTGGPKVTAIARRFLVNDVTAFAAELDAIAAIPKLVRAIPGHGAILEGSAAPAGLRRAAAALRSP